jgi:integrase
VAGLRPEHDRHAPEPTRHRSRRDHDREVERPVSGRGLRKERGVSKDAQDPEFLREMLAWHLGTYPNDEWVFTAPGSNFLRYDNFRRRLWVPAIEGAGLSPLTFHQLRHTAPRS